MAYFHERWSGIDRRHRASETMNVKAKVIQYLLDLIRRTSEFLADISRH